MASLQYSHKRFVVKMLALGKSPDEVAQLVNEKFLVQTSEEEILPLVPEASDENALSHDLEKLYQIVRDRHKASDDDSTEAEPEFTSVARLSDLEADSHLCVEVDGKRIALFKWGNSVFALDDRCSHQGGPLSDGFVSDGMIECPWHGACFSLKTGDAVQVPATESVNSYEVRLGKEHIEIKL